MAIVANAIVAVNKAPMANKIAPTDTIVAAHKHINKLHMEVINAIMAVRLAGIVRVAVVIALVAVHMAVGK